MPTKSTNELIGTALLTGGIVLLPALFSVGLFLTWRFFSAILKVGRKRGDAVE